MLTIVAVYDRAVGAFGTPFFVKHVNEAIRSFSGEVRREGSALGANPEDYDLHNLGVFDESSGEIRPSDGNPMVAVLARGSEVARSLS